MDDVTLTVAPAPWSLPATDRFAVPMLQVIWSVDEPERVGEVLLIDTRGPGIFGRQSTSSERNRLQLRRIRPGRFKDRGSPTTRQLSRKQLRIESTGQQTIRVDNTGRCPMRVDGQLVKAAVLRPGQVLRQGQC